MDAYFANCISPALDRTLLAVLFLKMLLSYILLSCAKEQYCYFSYMRIQVSFFIGWRCNGLFLVFLPSSDRRCELVSFGDGSRR